MNILRSRRTAIAVTAVAVAVSAVLGCHRSLAAERRGVEKLMVTGVGEYGSIAGDAREMVDIARNLVTVAKKYIPQEQDLFDQLEEYCKQVETAGDIFDWKNGAAGIRSRCEVIQMKLAGCTDVTEQDRRYLSGFQVNMEAALHRMSRDPYNSAARDFNDNILGAFPANILGPLTGVKPLDTFENMD